MVTMGAASQKPSLQQVRLLFSSTSALLEGLACQLEPKQMHTPLLSSFPICTGLPQSYTCQRSSNLGCPGDGACIPACPACLGCALQSIA